MSGASQIDYDALAKKYGATSSQVDYDALAKQHGALSSSSESGQQPSFGERVTAGYNPGAAEVTKVPVLNQAVRFFDATGGAVLGLPGSIYHTVADPLTEQEQQEFQGHTQIPGEVTLERLLGGPLVRGAQQYANPQTRPTLRQAMSVLPEALGQGTGTAVGTELAARAGLAAAKPAAKAAGSVARVASDFVDPDITGLISPRLAHLQRLAGKVGRLADKVAPGTEAEPAAAAARPASPSAPTQSAPVESEGTPVNDAGKFTKPKPNPPYTGPRVPSAMAPVESGNVGKIGYHESSNTMVIEYKSGDVYEYRGVPKKVFDNVADADSIGSYISRNIKGRYETNYRGNILGKSAPGAAKNAKAVAQAQALAQALGQARNAAEE